MMRQWGFLCLMAVFGILFPQAGLSAPVNYRLDCVFQDKAVFEPVCLAIVDIRHPAARAPKENSISVHCSKGAPLYHGLALMQITQDLATIRSSGQGHPTLVLPRYPLEDTSTQEVSASLTLPEGTLSGLCEVRPTVN